MPNPKCCGIYCEFWTHILGIVLKRITLPHYDAFACFLSRYTFFSFVISSLYPGWRFRPSYHILLSNFTIKLNIISTYILACVSHKSELYIICQVENKRTVRKMEDKKLRIAFQANECNSIRNRTKSTSREFVCIYKALHILALWVV